MEAGAYVVVADRAAVSRENGLLQMPMSAALLSSLCIDSRCMKARPGMALVSCKRRILSLWQQVLFISDSVIFVGDRPLVLRIFART